MNGAVDEALQLDDEFWGLKVVVKKTGLSRSTIYAYVASGSFPMQRRLGRRRIAWLASQVKKWIASRPTVPIP
ncbi:MAG: helix-turn-helix transcriptional regulator [Pirellulaceae bacterium]